MISLMRRCRRMPLLALFGFVLSTTLLAAPAVTTRALATGSYPPRTNCALSAYGIPGAVDMTISGTGFIPRRAIDLSVASERLASATADSAGSFQVARHIPPNASAHPLVSATDGHCSPHSSIDAGFVPQTDTSPPPIVLGQSEKLISAALPAEIFVAVIASVIAVGLVLYFAAERSGRRIE